MKLNIIVIILHIACAIVCIHEGLAIGTIFSLANIGLAAYDTFEQWQDRKINKQDK